MLAIKIFLGLKNPFKDYILYQISKIVFSFLRAKDMLYR